MCWNPASMSSASSCSLWATLHVKSSFSARNMACSMFMYIMVLLMFLCPKTCLTCMMSLVLWYSIVPFQCRNVWNDILWIRGFWSFWAVAFRCASNEVLNPPMFFANIPCLVCGSWFSMFRSLSDTGSILGLLFFDGVMLRVFCSVDRSIHWSFTASDILMPVSFSVWSSGAVRFPHDAIS